MTDNRTNEPTEAQVEAAAKVLRDDKANRTDTYRVPEWEDMPYGDKLVFRGQAQAALVAAQGATPQDEPSEEWLTWCREESCVHRHWRSGGMPTHRRGDDCPTPGNHAPVLPSSTVDEALRFCTCSHWLEAHHERKCLEHHCACVNFQPLLEVDEDALAEVIAKSRGFGNGWEQIPPLTRGAYREIARAVAEWLKEQGR